ncbi:hypothetical protein IQ277_15520 [Nostocales cyanobacterium LEGE 12452]|nr:hypothetical protein [Nostocales cyanobacterium LEGE 12452]
MISRPALRSIEILLVEDSSIDANLTTKGFLSPQIGNNWYWVEDGESAMADSSNTTTKVIELEISIVTYSVRELSPI